MEGTSHDRVVIYCNYRQPGGVERVSVRLRRLLAEFGVDATLVSYDGSPIYEQPTEDASSIRRSDLVVFSRKSDVSELRSRFMGGPRVYWRHVPYFQLGPLRRALDMGFTVLMSWTGRVACNCEELRDLVRGLPGIRRSAVHCCYSPIDGVEEGPVRFGAIDCRRPVSLVYFGREGKQKRVEDAIRLVSGAARLGLDVHLNIFGYQKPLEVEGADPGCYTFRGITDRVPDVMSEADGLLVVSGYEAFPTIMMEAARMGLPIFCNDFEVGRRDFERRVGPLNSVDPDEPESLVRALRSHEAGRYSFDDFTPREIHRQWLAALG